MKLTIERSHALAALSRVTGVVARNSNVPILNNVLISAAGDGVTFRATDLDMEATASCPANIQTPGTLTVDAGKLREVVASSAPGAELSMELDTGDDPRLIVKSGRSRFKLPVLAADMFPKIPADDYAVTFIIEAEILSDMLTRTVFAAGNDMSKPALIGSHLTVDGKSLLAVGCSGRRFATVRYPLPKLAAKMPPVTLPTKSVGQFVKLLDGAADVEVSVSENKFRVVSGDSEIVCKVIDYAYLNYKIGIPDTAPHTALADKATLVSAVRRALIAGESDSVGVGIKLSFSAGLLSVTGKNPAEEASDEIEIEYDGPEIAFGLTAPYILDAVRNVDGETVEIGIGDDLTVAVFRKPGDDVAVNTAVKRMMR